MTTPKTYLAFNEKPQAVKRKTKVWTVASAPTAAHLGVVKWHAAWRQYCFFPESNTLWNPDCLDELEEFLRVATETHKEKAHD